MDNGSSNGNRSDDQGLLYPSEYILGITIFNAIFSVAGTFGNVLVLVAICKNKCLQSIPDLYIFSLASADLIVTAIRQPLLIHKANNNFSPDLQENSIVLKVFTQLGNVGSPATLTSMLAVTIDRFLAIRHPLRYQLYSTSKRAIFVISSCWTVSVLVAVAMYFLESQAQYFAWALYVICLLSTILIYIYIFLVAKKQENKIITVQTVQDTNLPNRSSQQRQERKAAKTIALVVGVYILFYVPFLAYTISRSDIKGLDFFIGFYWFYSILLCNSAVNPVIYGLRSSRYRRAFIGILGLKQDWQVDVTQ